MEQIVSWAMSHQMIIGAAIVGLLDLVFALVPSWQSNGILHWIFVMAKKLNAPNDPTKLQDPK